MQRNPFNFEDTETFVSCTPEAGYSAVVKTGYSRAGLAELFIIFQNFTMAQQTMWTKIGTIPIKPFYDVIEEARSGTYVKPVGEARIDENGYLYICPNEAITNDYVYMRFTFLIKS